MFGQSVVLLVSKDTQSKLDYCNFIFRPYKPFLLLKASGSVTNIAKTVDNTPEAVPIAYTLH